MNDFLEFTGFVLYLAVSIITFPLYLALQFLLWSVSQTRQAKKHLAYILDKRVEQKTQKNKPVFVLQRIAGLIWQH